MWPVRGGRWHAGVSGGGSAGCTICRRIVEAPRGRSSYPAGIGSAVVCLIRSIANREVTFFSGIAAISRL